MTSSAASTMTLEIAEIDHAQIDRISLYCLRLCSSIELRAAADAGVPARVGDIGK